MRRAGLLTTVVLTLALTSCGSGATSNENGTARDQPTPAETTTPTATQTVEATPSAKVLSKPKLESALLTLQDLPPGYSQDPPSEERTKNFCDYKPPFGNGLVYARADFTKGAGMSAEFVRVGLRQFASASEAKASFQALVDALKTCRSETYAGSKLTYSAMSTPKLGEGAIGVKIDADGTTLVQNFVLVGPTLVATGGGGLLNTDADSLTRLLTAQVNRYTAAASK